MASICSRHERVINTIDYNSDTVTNAPHHVRRGLRSIRTRISLINTRNLSLTELKGKQGRQQRCEQRQTTNTGQQNNALICESVRRKTRPVPLTPARKMRGPVS